MIRRHRRGTLGALLGSAVLLATTIATMPTAIADPGPGDGRRPDAKPVQQEFTAEQVRVMARSAGRSEDGQRRHLERKSAQNNAYARLAATHRFDGAYFKPDGTLVVQVGRGSKAGPEAERAGLEVRTPRFGETHLYRVTDELSAELAGRQNVVSVAPDVAADTVVVTLAGDAEPEVDKALAAHGDAVEVRRGERNVTYATVSGGDRIVSNAGASCSAGFPAKTDDGRAAMVWAGHCIEGGRTFSVGSTRAPFAAFGATGFTSNDGRPDRDLGYLLVNKDSQMTSQVNGYGREVSQADRGAWKAPVGTDLCKSGATSGVTCGQVTGYNATVNYGDAATVTGLGVSTVCSAPGDSGGAYVSGGYAVGMTSGGPARQSCPFNGGVVANTMSYFQPVTDALEYYGLTYGS